MNADSRRTQLRDLLKKFRGRLRPHEVGLPVVGGRRVPGLRSDEVAELVGVSTAWYEALEFGGQDRRFSPPFIQRVADALRLDDRERLALLRLALPEVADATDIFERSLLDGALRHLSAARAFVKRLTCVSSFQEAAIAAVETTHGVVAPTCVTAASLERDGDTPETIAVGPRAQFAGNEFARTALEINQPARDGATVLCENAPHPSDVRDHARHLVRIRTGAGDTAGVHDPGAEDYRKYNGRLLERSSTVVGLFERGIFRGNISASWVAPREHPPLEVEFLKMLAATLELAAGPYLSKS